MYRIGGIVRAEKVLKIVQEMAILVNNELAEGEIENETVGRGRMRIYSEKKFKFSHNNNLYL